MPSLISLPPSWEGWKVTELIGEGSYGSVYKAERVLGKEVFVSAIKVIEIPSSHAESNASLRAMFGKEHQEEYFQNIVDTFVKEITAMLKLRGNSYIVSIEDYVIEKKTDRIGWTIYIRMEYLQPLDEYMIEHSFTEEDVLSLGKDIANALTYCEKLNIVHCDIKPENIFVTENGTFKLGDFGAIKRLDATVVSITVSGTWSYIAPEVYQGKRPDKRADIYALGLVLYRMLNKNRAPFLDTEKAVVYYEEQDEANNRRMRGEEIPEPVHGSAAIKRVVMKACHPDPERRYQNARELLKDLQNVGVEEPVIEPTIEEAPSKGGHRGGRVIRISLAAAGAALAIFIICRSYFRDQALDNGKTAGFNALGVEAVTEKASEKASEKAIEKTTEEVTEEIAEKATEEVTEEVTEKATEEVTEEVTEKVTEEVTEEVTEKVTEEVTEKVTEKATEEETEKITEKVAEEITEKISKITTEAETVAVQNENTDDSENTAAEQYSYPRYAASLSEISDGKLEVMKEKAESTWAQLHNSANLLSGLQNYSENMKYLGVYFLAAKKENAKIKNYIYLVYENNFSGDFYYYNNGSQYQHEDVQRYIFFRFENAQFLSADQLLVDTGKIYVAGDDESYISGSFTIYEDDESYQIRGYKSLDGIYKDCVAEYLEDFEYETTILEDDGSPEENNSIYSESELTYATALSDLPDKKLEKIQEIAVSDWEQRVNTANTEPRNIRNYSYSLDLTNMYFLTSKKSGGRLQNMLYVVFREDSKAEYYYYDNGSQWQEESITRYLYWRYDNIQLLPDGSCILDPGDYVFVGEGTDAKNEVFTMMEDDEKYSFTGFQTIDELELTCISPMLEKYELDTNTFVVN